MIPVTVSLQLPSPLLVELLDFLRDNDDEQDLSQAASDALRDWLDQKTHTPPKPAQMQTQPQPRGYLWKSLFLPEGTMLKKFLSRGDDCAIVEGDRLMYRGSAVSPNQFASFFSGCVRNAWRDLSIWMPHDRHWKYASVRRREARQQQAQQ